MSYEACERERPPRSQGIGHGVFVWRYMLLRQLHTVSPRRSGAHEGASRARRSAPIQSIPTLEKVMNTKLNAEQIANRSLDAFFAKDMKGWSELCDPNVIVEFPFAPEGLVSRLQGRTAIYEYLKNYPSIIDIKEFTSKKVYTTNDPNTVIVEWGVSGKVIANNNPYVMS